MQLVDKLRGIKNSKTLAARIARGSNVYNSGAPQAHKGGHIKAAKSKLGAYGKHGA
jgi:hypothetical protein